MQLHSMVVDDFLGDFDGVRGWVDNYAQFPNVVNPVDGVTYPGICSEIPDALRDEVHKNLCLILATNQVTIRSIFARLSVAGVNVPHQAHNDASMGMFSLMLYLNRPEHCDGGTELVRYYEDGIMEYGPQDEGELYVWGYSANWASDWERLSMCPMRSNRAFIFDARLMHRAQPIGGFGKDATDGRLVLTAFFDL